MEKLLLGPLLAGDELDVVDEKRIDIPVLFPEFLHLVVTDRVDHFIHELLGRDIEHVSRGDELQGVEADGIEKMGLSETHAAINEKRIVILCRCLGNGDGSGMGKLIAGADDKTIKIVVGIQRRVKFGSQIGFVVVSLQ